MTNETNTQICPYCKETILAGATKCKFCKSTIEAKEPAHQGICPYCKEVIKPDAIRCIHCGADLSQRSTGCCSATSKQASRSCCVPQFQKPGACPCCSGQPFDRKLIECHKKCTCEHPAGFRMYWIECR